jgi:hypothetical protein
MSARAAIDLSFMGILSFHSPDIHRRIARSLGNWHASRMTDSRCTKAARLDLFPNLQSFPLCSRRAFVAALFRAVIWDRSKEMESMMVHGISAAGLAFEKRDRGPVSGRLKSTWSQQNSE